MTTRPPGARRARVLQEQVEPRDEVEGVDRDRRVWGVAIEWERGQLAFMESQPFGREVSAEETKRAEPALGLSVNCMSCATWASGESPVPQAYQRNRPVSVAALVRPEPDLAKLVIAVVNHHYVPHRSLSEAELRAYRKSVHTSRPSLAHQAGKSFARLARELRELRDAAVETPLPRAYQQNRPVAVAALVDPEPDLAKVVVAMVYQRLEQKGLTSTDPEDGPGHRAA